MYLAEGPWPGKAYFDARKRARERDAGLQINYGFIQPNVFSRGPINQKIQDNDMINSNQNRGQAAPPQPVPESLPPPVPTPPAPGGTDTTQLLPSRPGRQTPGGVRNGSIFDAAPPLPGASRDNLSYDWGQDCADPGAERERGNGRRQAGGPRGDGADFLYDSCDGAGAAER